MAYQIDFSDLTKPSFSISDYSFNGPGGISVNSSLRLYGRNAQEWGEAVNENLLRLAENWASATPPINPINGQSWVKEEIYWRNSSVILFPAPSAPATSFYRYNFTTNSWDEISANVQVINGPLPPSAPIGSYVYNILTSTLYRYDSQYKQTTFAWLERNYRVETTTPGLSDNPRNDFLIYNEAEASWKSLTPNVGIPVTNQFVKITTNNTGNITATSPVTTTDVTPLVDSVYVNITGDTMTGNLTMSGGSQVLGLPPTPSATAAASKEYVDNQDALKLNLTGGVLTGSLTLSGPPAGPNEAATKQYVDNLINILSNTIFPVGMITDYGGSVAPAGWLICDGQAVSRTTYADLFAVIGVTYGDGDGSTTFNLPDARGRVGVGVGPATFVENLVSQPAIGNAVSVVSNTDTWITGMPVIVSNVSGFSGLTNGSWWIIRVNNNQIRFATSLENAQNNIAQTITGTGTATITYQTDSRLLGGRGGESSHAQNINEFLKHAHTFPGIFQTLPQVATLNPKNFQQEPRFVNISTTTTSIVGNNVAMNNMQPYIVLNKIIKF